MKLITAYTLLILLIVITSSCKQVLVKEYNGPHVIDNAEIGGSPKTAQRNSAILYKIDPLKSAGRVIGVTNSEIIVTGLNISSTITIGELLLVDTGDDSRITVIKAHFPMMTHLRCALHSGKISDIKKGMLVYKK